MESKYYAPAIIKLTHNKALGNRESLKLTLRKRMSNLMFIVSIYRTLADHLYISAFNESTSEMFLIELPASKSLSVLN